MLIIVLRKNQIVNFRYFDNKGIGFYLFIIANKIILRKIEIINHIN